MTDITDNFTRDDDFTSNDSGRRGAKNLIAAERVKGTEVYNRGGDKIGSIDSILIDKVSGEVAYVVMSFGGFLGIGERFHPLPWDVLSYDTKVDGYRVDLDRSQLEGAPNYGRDDVDSFDYASNGSGIDDYYEQQGGARRGSRSPDYDNSETGRREPPKGFYSPEAQSERTSGQGVRTDHEDTETADGGFYSPEQQAARNLHEQDGEGLVADTVEAGRAPVGAGGTADWSNSDRR